MTLNKDSRIVDNSTHYTRAGQAAKGSVELWWERFQHRLGMGAEVWLVLAQRGPCSRPLTRASIGRLCPSGLTSRQVEKQLIKLRRLGLIKDGVPVRKQVTRRGRAPAWVTTIDRLVVGEARFQDDRPYLVMLPKGVRRAVINAGSGGANGVTRKQTVSPEASQTTESLGNPEQTVSCSYKSNTLSTSTPEVKSVPDGTDASAPPVSLPKPEPAMLQVPGPRKWDDMPLGDKQAARHIFRLYNSWRDTKYRKPLFVRGDIARQKWWPALVAATKALRAADIPPGAWIAWFGENMWKPKKSSSAPPIQALFSIKAIEERSAWFWATQADLGLVGRHWVAPASRELAERWRLHDLQRRIHTHSGKVPKPANLLSPAEYDSLRTRAETELESKRIEIHDALGAAEWLW